MSASLLTAIGALITALFAAMLPFYREHQRTKLAEAKAEAERIEARDKTQRENEEWLRTRVDEMVRHERDLYRTTLESMQREIAALKRTLEETEKALDDARSALASVPPLVEDLARYIARINPDRTPTQAELDRLRAQFGKLGARPSVASEVLLGKVPT